MIMKWGTQAVWPSWWKKSGSFRTNALISILFMVDIFRGKTLFLWFLPLSLSAQFKTVRLMKKVLLVLIAFFFFSSTINAQQKAKKKDIVLYLPYTDKDKTLPEVINIVSSVDGVTPVAFCVDLRCLLLTVDQGNPENELKLYEHLKKGNVKFDIKLDAVIPAVLKESKKIITAETQWQ